MMFTPALSLTPRLIAMERPSQGEGELFFEVERKEGRAEGSVSRAVSDL